jgi:hypothetical protein
MQISFWGLAPASTGAKCLSGKLEIAQVDGDHEQVANRPEVRPAHIGASTGRHPDALDIHEAVNVLSRRE